MGGEGAYRKLAPPGDASAREQIKQRQQAWRNANSETVRFWSAVNRRQEKAIQKPGTATNAKRSRSNAGAFLFMHLPSGRKIAYPFSHLKTNNRGDCVVVFMDNDKGKWAQCRNGQGAYGGTLGSKMWCRQLRATVILLRQCRNSKARPSYCPAHPR